MGDLSADQIKTLWPGNDVSYEFLYKFLGCDTEGCYEPPAQTFEEYGCAAEPMPEACDNYEGEYETNSSYGCGYELLIAGAELSGYSKYLGNFVSIQECREAWVAMQLNEQSAVGIFPSFIYGHGAEQGNCYAESVNDYRSCEQLDVDMAPLSGDGYCDTVLNNANCGWDAGDCCSETCGIDTRGIHYYESEGTCGSSYCLSENDIF